MTQLHGILTTFEMRKGCPSDMREADFKALANGKEKEENNESTHFRKRGRGKFFQEASMGFRKI